MGGNPAGRLLSARPLVGLGDRSYSVYLWHWPAVVFASAVVPGSITIRCAFLVVFLGISELAYRFVETPIRVKEFAGKPRIVLVVSLMVPVLAASSLLYAVSTRVDKPLMIKIGESGCLLPTSGPPFSDALVKNCTWQGVGGKGTLYLLGDSAAGYAGEGVLEAGKALGMDTVALTRSSCPPFGYADARMEKECTFWYSNVMRWLEQQDPGVVMVMLADSYWEDGEVDGGPARPGENMSLDEYKYGLAEFLKVAKDAGHRVILVSPPPSLGPPISLDPSSCNFLSKALGGCVYTVPLSDLPAFNRVLEAEKSAAKEAGVEFLDLTPVLCDSGKCSALLNGLRAYVYKGHLMPQAARMLEPSLRKALER